METVLNSAVIYILVLTAIRILGKKELGDLSVSDLIFIMLISEAVGDVMRASNDTLWGGLIAAVTLMIINKILKIATYKSKKFSRFMEGSPSILIHNGQVNKKEMKRNKINIEELEQAGREHGFGDISKIKIAILEKDGKVSILENDDFKSSEIIRS
ncbi:MAG: DUF421 domain-containing protein [Rikenellaceae bacterium]|nr:DUF421 domain-containing protein [Rikenellaceae bacterium]